MAGCSIVFYDTGLNSKIPDLQRVSAAVFPFWGDYTFLDCSLADYLQAEDARRILVLEGPHRAAHGSALSRWKKAALEVVLLSNGIESFIETLEGIESKVVILSALSYVASFDGAELCRLAARRGRRLDKIAAGGVPLELYSADRGHLVELLRAAVSRYLGHGSFGAALFERILHTSFDELVEIPGDFFLQNDLMELYGANMALLGLRRNAAARLLYDRLARFAPERPTSVVGEKAYVKNSHLGSGVDIQGHVENSVIFSRVGVKAKTKIIDSVIMNDNQIGGRSTIAGAMLFPYSREAMKGSSNIEDAVSIGSASSTARNRDFPDQIRDGLTVIGMNAEIPRGAVIEPGCYVGGGVSAHDIKRLKTLKRGSSVYQGD